MRRADRGSESAAPTDPRSTRNGWGVWPGPVGQAAPLPWAASATSVWSYPQRYPAGYLVTKPYNYRCFLSHPRPRTSSATAPRLPDADQGSTAAGQTRDLPGSDAILSCVMWPSTPVGRQHLA